MRIHTGAIFSILGFFCLTISCNAQDEDYLSYLDDFVFNTYLNDIYNEGDDGAYDFKLLPDISNLENVSPKKYIFDVEDLITRLRNTGLFTENYIRTDSLKVIECNEAMMQEDWDFYPDPEFNIAPCNYIWADRFSGAYGNTIDDYKIVSKSFLANGAWKANIRWMDSGQNTPFKCSIVLKKINGIIKIDEVSDVPEIEWY